MIERFPSAIGKIIILAVGNHLWQSTLVAIIAGMVSLMLRKNQAQVRYWLWFAASVKLLIPFSLLVYMGRHLTWLRGSPAMKPGLYVGMALKQSVARPAIVAISSITHSTVSSNLINQLPELLAAGWFCGFLVVLLLWCVRWRRISAAIRDSKPLREGREVETLRRLECVGSMENSIEMVLSYAAVEPGIFGIARPVLVWPMGISERLEDAHLEAILAHEVWHVRRRDNLTAAIHMIVEAVFWFYPLAWWLGARLVQERENACDEEVLRLGNRRHVYAEGILKVCEFCAEFPLLCVSGVTGADLNKRITRIMTQRVVRELGFGAKLFLSVVGILTLASPIVTGLADATPLGTTSQTSNSAALPVYEVASIRPSKFGSGGIISWDFPPNGISAKNVTLQRVIQMAYGVEDYQISGAPKWLNAETYNLEAKTESHIADKLRELTFEQRGVEQQPMLQALLADRCKLILHRESRELPVYALTIAKGGLKIQQAKPDNTYPNGMKDLNGHGHGNIMGFGRGSLTGQGVPIAFLARMLSQQQLGRPVLDMTGLKGDYDFALEWTPGESHREMFKGTEVSGQEGSLSPSSFDSSGASIFTAIQDQLGLKLESQRGPVEILVIDHVERPSEN
jgi:bla regulator protein blaR1